MQGIASSLARLSTLVRRRRAAKRLGIDYRRGRGFSTPTCVVVDGRRYAIHVPQERGVAVAFAEIFLDDCYRLTSSLAAVRPATILDIGGNVGLFSLFARTRYRDAVIHTYEPNRALEPYLEAQSREGAFRVHYEAVGKAAGFVTLVSSEDSVLTHVEAAAGGSVPQVSFASAVGRFGGSVDLVKMDCEGAEWEIFEDRAIWKAVGALSMEYHLVNGRSHDDAPRLVRDLGMAVLKHVPSEGCGIVVAVRQ